MESGYVDISLASRKGAMKRTVPASLINSAVMSESSLTGSALPAVKAMWFSVSLPSLVASFKRDWRLESKASEWLRSQTRPWILSFWTCGYAVLSLSIVHEILSWLEPDRTTVAPCWMEASAMPKPTPEVPPNVKMREF